MQDISMLTILNICIKKYINVRMFVNKIYN